MVDRVIQSSFNIGELAPALYARTDFAKYHSGAALLRNFYVDYRGGASTRTGLQFIQQAYKSGTQVRLIPFPASVNVEYVLEFGDKYIRFYYQKQPILETPFAFTVVNPNTLSIPGHNYSVGDWFYVGRVAVAVTAVSGSNVSYGPVGPGTLDPITASGTSARIYTIASPYAAADLSLIKFAQNVTQMILCHPNYVPYQLSLITAANWLLTPIIFGSAAAIPTGVKVSTTLGGGKVSYSYTVTSFDSKNEESGMAPPAKLTAKSDIRISNGTIRVSWNAVSGATSYNVYKSDVTYFGSGVPAGVPYGYIGNVQGTNFDDSNIGPDFTQTPPVPQDPFQGAGIATVTVGAPGAYTTVPSVQAVTAIGQSPNVNASLAATLEVTSSTAVASTAPAQYAVGDLVYFPFGVTLVVATINSNNDPTSYTDVTVDPQANQGILASGNTPPNPVTSTGSSGLGTGAQANLFWGVGAVIIQNAGSGYTAVPTITFAPAGATATATLLPAGTGNPSVPAFFQQRMFLAAPVGNPAGFYFSQPGNYFNFNVSKPSEADDSISGTLVSGQLQVIKAAVPTAGGLIIFTDKGTWLLNGGSGSGSGISPSAIVANPQSYTGSSDLPPIIANFDILYVQEKGAIVRDSTYNIYANIYTGSDISVTSSHLFYGYDLIEWAYAEEPFKLVWIVRSDGVLLSLTFLKEQDFIGWAHSDTNGLFKSIATVTEQAAVGRVDAVYTVVQRTIQGQTYQYIERMTERNWNVATDTWCVDAGVQYNGTPSTSFTGAIHLAGQTVTGLADGVVIPSFTMPVDGSFTLPVAASIVTVGLSFTAQLKTLAIDTGEPTIQGKQKKISDSVLRVKDTLGLKIGTTFSNLVAMKDLTVGNVGSYSNTVVTNLTSTDARTYLDPDWNAFGQYCIQQDQPLPASILGVMPGIIIGDTAK